jgi:hypothetical protein
MKRETKAVKTDSVTFRKDAVQKKLTSYDSNSLDSNFHKISSTSSELGGRKGGGLGFDNLQTELFESLPLSNVDRHEDGESLSVCFCET